LTPQGLGNRRFLDCNGVVHGVVKTDDLSLLTGLSLLSTKPQDVSRVCVTFLFLRTGTIQFHTGGSMAQCDSGISNMQSTRSPEGLFDFGVSKLL
jgi:hypothetical protein